MQQKITNREKDLKTLLIFSVLRGMIEGYRGEVWTHPSG